jgi:DNA recombination protein RmuC
MSVTEILLIVLVVAVLAMIALQAISLLRHRDDGSLIARLDALKDDNRHLRDALAAEQRAGRGEMAQTLGQFRSLVQEQLGGMSAQQHERIGQFGQRLDVLTERTDIGLQSLSQRLTEDARRSREELTLALNHFGEQQQQRLAALTADNEKRMGEVRATLEAKLGAMQQDNAAPRSRKSCRPRWKRVWANRSSWSLNASKPCSAALAKCRAWLPAWAISSAC